MWKYFAFLYFFIATVTAQEQNGPNHVQRVQSQPLINHPHSQDTFVGVPRHFIQSPCRRKLTFNNNAPEPSLGPYNPPIFYPLDQRIVKAAVENDQMPQSLKENRATDKQQKVMDESTEQTPDVKANSVAVEAGSEQELLKTSDAVEDRGIKPFILCDRIIETDDGFESDTDSKIEEMQEHILKLLLNCVQNKKKVLKDGSSRRSLTKSVVPSLDTSSAPPLSTTVNDNGNDKDDADRKNGDSDKGALLESPLGEHTEKKPSLQTRRKSTLEERSNNDADDIVSQLKHPAKGVGIVKFADSQVMLMENTRVCYACSTANDPSCWHPDKTTTIKYCKKEDTACVTKTFQRQGETILIRDCGNTCNDHDMGVLPKYESCRICHTDTCNSASSVKSLGVLLLSFIITVFKYALR